MSTIFIDRDGVINENRADYVKSWAEFRFIPGAREAVAQLTRAGHRVFVCTNQAAVAKGLITTETVEEIHQRMIAEVAAVGGEIEKAYYCPHPKDGDCACRKPRPGMLLRARDEFGANLDDAIFIGDSITDIQAGIAAGVRPMLVLTGLGMEQFRNHSHEVSAPFRITMNLKHAVATILKGAYADTNVPTRLERACYAALNVSSFNDPLVLLRDQFAMLT